MEKIKDKYYAILDRYEDIVEDDGAVRQRIAKPVFRDGLCVFRRAPVVSGNVIIEQEKCHVIRPNQGGIYSIAGNDPYIEEKALAMSRYMEKHPIIGPFDSMKDAMIAQNDARPKTEAEKLAAENAELRAQLEKQKKG